MAENNLLYLSQADVVAAGISRRRTFTSQLAPAPRRTDSGLKTAGLTQWTFAPMMLRLC